MNEEDRKYEKEEKTYYEELAEIASSNYFSSSLGFRTPNEGDIITMKEYATKACAKVPEIGEIMKSYFNK